MTYFCKTFSLKALQIVSDEENTSKVAVKSKSIPGYAFMGTQLFASVLGMWGIGWWIDSEYGTAPKWGITFLILGAISGFYQFIRQAISISKKK